MTRSLSLSRHFASHLEQSLHASPEDLERIERTLTRLLEQAREVWPTLELPPEHYLAHLARRVPAEGDPIEALDALHTDDLYLACACTHGDPAAIACFEERLFPAMERALVRLRLSPSMADEVKQTMREQLFVVSGRRNSPMICSYAGLGPLRNWIKVITVRTAGALMDRSRREVPVDKLVFDEVLSPGDDPELTYLKSACRREFHLAFEEAMSSLSERERNVLKQYYLDGLSIDEIGLIYRVHRTTAARWLSRSRKQLLRHTRRALMAQLQVGPDEFESIIRLIESQFGATLHSFLRD